MRKAGKSGLEVTAQPYLSNGLPHGDVQGSGNIPGESSVGDRKELFCPEKITSRYGVTSEVSRPEHYPQNSKKEKSIF